MSDNTPTTFGSFGTMKKQGKKDDIAGWLGISAQADELHIPFRQEENITNKESISEQKNKDNSNQKIMERCIDQDDDKDLE